MTFFPRCSLTLPMAALALVVVLPAPAQSISASERQFVRSSLETNNAEISAAHLALDRTTSNDVKQFAERMIHDHTMLNNQL